MIYLTRDPHVEFFIYADKTPSTYNVSVEDAKILITHFLNFLGITSLNQDVFTSLFNEGRHWVRNTRFSETDTMGATYHPSITMLEGYFDKNKVRLFFSGKADVLLEYFNDSL